jgi:predicted RNase H-like HicB family nuclease
MEKEEKYIFWKEDQFWIGYLERFPDYWTQGETMNDLEEHLKDLYFELTGDNQHVSAYA